MYSEVMYSHRRDFLRAIIGGAAGLTLSTTAFGQTASAPITATKLTDRLALLEGDGGNVMVVISDDGLMMIDGGLPDRSGELLRAASSQGRDDVPGEAVGKPAGALVSSVADLIVSSFGQPLST